MAHLTPCQWFVAHNRRAADSEQIYIHLSQAVEISTVPSVAVTRIGIVSVLRIHKARPRSPRQLPTCCFPIMSHLDAGSQTTSAADSPAVRRRSNEDTPLVERWIFNFSGALQSAPTALLEQRSDSESDSESRGDAGISEAATNSCESVLRVAAFGKSLSGVGSLLKADTQDFATLLTRSDGTKVAPVVVVLGLLRSCARQLRCRGCFNSRCRICCFRPGNEQPRAVVFSS